MSQMYELPKTDGTESRTYKALQNLLKAIGVNDYDSATKTYHPHIVGNPYCNVDVREALNALWEEKLRQNTL